MRKAASTVRTAVAHLSGTAQWVSGFSARACVDAPRCTGEPQPLSGAVIGAALHGSDDSPGLLCSVRQVGALSFRMHTSLRRARSPHRSSSRQ
jgi:hypothetical protein